jgi:hypothetical protein
MTRIIVADRFPPMETKIQATWFICTISRESFSNWEICKRISAWGVADATGRVKLDKAKAGDRLVFYASGKGFLGVAEVIGPMRRPTTPDQAPWPGSHYRYGAVIPFALDLELDPPMKVIFPKMIIEGTSIHTSRLQKGFSMITGEDGNYLLRKMKEFHKANREAKKANKIVSLDK